MDGSAGICVLRVVISLALVFCLCASSALAIVDDKCSACKAVALELEDSLANERPRNHLDYRHRLNSEGQREGKVIDYRLSELRVVELLDGLCSKMKGYVPNKAGPGRTFWLKVEGGVPDAPEMALNRQASELHSRAIVEFCGRLLETTEEELTERIRVGEVATGEVERVLCKELSKSCKELSETAEPADDDDLEDEEIDEVATERADDHVKEDAEKATKDVSSVAEETISMGSDGEL
ncbi:uncharacterized protein [Physcomitrium patens]|uniref:DUF3456 domain-containing protein n=1 Tax=Physcomitrium patens TaxID=3218 RepID=A0A2K1KVF1_PHYPA|nr:uncharacterized protein LOC112280014 [Physcomitrium patens]PNR57764.1 hypothetical protein PHYPA_004758 [Physcomitrium patens]|eukprot:XP_024370686.1 uncharacterized protein LOC112280014 [Physcomitrella patens]